MNAVAEALTGWAKEEGTGQPLDAVFRIVNEETRETVQNPAMRAMHKANTPNVSIPPMWRCGFASIILTPPRRSLE